MKPKLFLTLFAMPLALLGQEAENFSLTPEIHGTLRGRYEFETEQGEGRFQVRNARVSLNGKVAPIIDYYVQVDACDKGEMKFLDAWGRISFTKEFKLQVGQFRKPFGVDAFRNPANLYFANRSFIGKQVGTMRGVGGKVIYNSLRLPLVIEAGIFNASTADDHTTYSKDVSFSSRALYTIGNITLSGGYQTIKPYETRMNFADANVMWHFGRWHIEGEYVYKHYNFDVYKDCHAYNFFTCYTMPVKFSVFSQLALLARWDGTTDHSDSKTFDETLQSLTTTEQARNRITAGCTLKYKYKTVRCDIRMNYEKYFYHTGVTATQGNRDKILAELVIIF